MDFRNKIGNIDRSGLPESVFIVSPPFNRKNPSLPHREMTLLKEIGQAAQSGDGSSGMQAAHRSGLLIMFLGRSGTGKALAAEIIAGETGKVLYRIDLSALLSRYIGETEKNLAGIFDAAAESSAVLFFDEADALFGKRSSGKNASERYANMEVSYLLQRMESYPGTVILSLAGKGNIDAAFLRRFRYILEISDPRKGED